MKQNWLQALASRGSEEEGLDTNLSTLGRIKTLLGDIFKAPWAAK